MYMKKIPKKFLNIIEYEYVHLINWDDVKKRNYQVSERYAPSLPLNREEEGDKFH